MQVLLYCTYMYFFPSALWMRKKKKEKGGGGKEMRFFPLFAFGLRMYACMYVLFIIV